MVRFLNAYTISAFAALGGLLLGFDISSMSGIIGTEQYKSYFGNPLGTRQGSITSAMAGGYVFGALSSSFLGDRFSRKVAIQFGAALWCAGVTVQSTSNGVAMLIVGRIISGLGVGISSTLVPIYQSEIAPRRFRGRIVSFQQFAITCGIMIQYCIEYGFSFLDSEAAVPGVLLFVSLFWFPHSPRWLASKDRWDDVLNVLAFLRSPNIDVSDPLVLAEYKEIEDQIRYEREETSNSFRELFSRKIRKRVLLSIAIQVWDQLSGMNVLMYYILFVLSSANVVNTYGAVGAVVMSFWFFLIGGLLMRYGAQNPVANQPVHISLAVATFAMSWGTVGWIYPPEVVPLRVRAKSVSVATAANWATNFALGLSVPRLLRSIRWRLFFVFASFNIGAFIHVLLGAPETKRRTLEELDEIFEYGEPLWKSFFGRPESNKLDLMARDIEIGILKINPPVRLGIICD
ncbi:hypothetical protein V1522DRAFT_460804 [Lipomyces starkeyi]